jgi:hypothetical protein
MYSHRSIYLSIYKRAYIHICKHSNIRVRSDTVFVAGSSRCARTRARAPTRTLACILRLRAYAYTRMHCYVHTHAHTHVPSGAHLVRAPLARPPRVGASAGRVSAAAAALTVSANSASRPPTAAPRCRCWTHPCAPTVRPRRAAFGPPRTRAGRPRC